MTQDASRANRRRFIKLTVGGFAAAPFGAALLGDTAAAAEMVSESDPQATALGYKADAKKAAKRTDSKAFCSTCNFYSGKPGAASGPCALFAGKLVSSKGWCTAWIKKPA
jgi:High potential iron-sulfur protein